jgi:hypothetical protein
LDRTNHGTAGQIGLSEAPRKSPARLTEVLPDDQVLEARSLVEKARRQRGDALRARDDALLVLDTAQERFAELETEASPLRRKLATKRSSYETTLRAATNLGLLEKEPQRTRLGQLREQVALLESELDAAVPGLAEARLELRSADERLARYEKIVTEIGQAQRSLLLAATQALALTRDAATLRDRYLSEQFRDPLEVARRELAGARVRPATALPKRKPPMSTAANTHLSGAAKVARRQAPKVRRTPVPEPGRPGRQRGLSDIGRKLMAALDREEQRLDKDMDHQSRVWDGNESLTSYLTRLGYSPIDKRGRRGCLWIVASEAKFAPHADQLRSSHIVFQFAKAGGDATGGRPGWWTKSGS